MKVRRLMKVLSQCGIREQTRGAARKVGHAALSATLLSALKVVLSVGVVHALPFNDDMVNINKHSRTGVMMRPKALNSVPLGSVETRLVSKQDAESLVNPLKGDPTSTASGKRLWAVNCLPCHGDISKTPYVPGYVAAKLPLIPPDPTTEVYKAKSDGFFYGVVHLGAQGIMPVLGWKFSATEHWDITNYIRAMQTAVRETR
jgi:mono/diheme cytochrome c family protein